MGLFNRKQKSEIPASRNNEQLPFAFRPIATAKKYAPVYSPSEAMKSSVVYRGIALLSDAVASVPVSIYHKNKDGYWEVDDKNPLYPILIASPSKRQNIYEFFENIVTHLVVYGNAFIFIKKDANYDVSELVLLYPNTVSYEEMSDRYIITDMYNKIQGTFTSEKIIHIRHKSLGTYLGQSVFTYAGRTIGLANATDSEALSTLQTGGKLKGIISSESSLTGFGSAIDGQVDTIRDNMQAEIESGKDIITLQSGAEFKPISQTMRDLQLVDLHNSTLSDLARYFGVSLVKLGINMGGNYQASLQDSLNFYNDTLNPLLKKIEAALTSKLIPATVVKKYKIEFDRTTLTYYKEILTNYEKMMQLGLASVNDIRRMINKTAVEGGDEVFITTNAQPLSAPKVDPAVEQTLEPEPQEQSTINTKENQQPNNE